MYQFGDIKSLQILFTELLKLRDLVKCPICLDVVKNSVQVRCTHTFCADCLNAFQNASGAKNLQCPICRKTISAKKFTNRRVEHLAKFVRDVSDKLKADFDCEGLDASTVHKVTSKLKKLQERGREEPSSSNQNVASTRIIPSTVCTKLTKAQFSKRRTSEELPLYKNDSPSTHNADVFDLQSTVPTRYKNIKTYDRKKASSKAPVVTFNKLIDFENDSNKLKIICWLTDSRNCFDRFSQTQQDTFEPDSIHSFDLPSTSQDRPEHMKTYAENLRKIRKSRAKLARKSRHERRARSLEFAIGSYAESPVFKRHSLACETPDFEVAHIEEVESQSDINDVMHLMEEDYLNALELDMNLGGENERAGAKNDSLTGQSTGWSRIKEIKRAIGKKERKPKKLDVTFTPTCPSNSKNKTAAAKRNSNEKKAVVLLSRLNVDKLDETVKLNENALHKVYNLNEIESYIESNILKCSAIAFEKNADDNCEMKDEDVIEEGSKGKASKEDTDTSGQKRDVIESDLNVNDAEESPYEGDVEENAIEKNEKGSVFLDDLFVQPTQVIEPGESERVADNIEEKLEVIFNTQPEKETQVANKRLILTDKINAAVEMMNDFKKVVALSSLNPSHFEKIKLACDEIRRLLDDEGKTNLDAASPKSPGLLNVTLRGNNTSIATTQTVHLDFKDAQIQTDEVVSRGFRISSSASFRTIRPGIEAETQTDPFRCGCNCIFSQRKPSEVLVQNRELVKHFATADEYQFTQSMDDVQFDTQDAVKNSLKDKSQNKLRLKKTQKPTDDYEFTQSLDNIQINTCDILRGMNESSALLEEKKRGNGSNSSTNKYKLNESLDDINFNTNEIVAKLTRGVQQSEKNLKSARSSAESCLAFSVSAKAQDKLGTARTPNTSRRFKRIKTPSSDSESDSENPRKMAKLDNNSGVRMRDDLSINFISESSLDVVDAAKKDDPFVLSIGGSENIDYDEYLEKIMRKYDDEIPCSTPKRAKSKRQPISAKRKSSPGEKIDTNEPPAKIKADDENFSESLFSNGRTENLLDARNTRNVTAAAVDEFKKHLRENDGELLDNNHLKEPGKSDGKVVILQDVIVKPGTASHSKLPYDLEEELARMEEDAEEKKSDVSEDMFASESEDLDVVETTPQKRSLLKNVFATQSLQKIKEKIPDDPPPSAASSCLDVTLPPPIEFQDLENTPDDLDVTLVSDVPPVIDLEGDDTLIKEAPLNKNTDSSPPPSEKLLRFAPIIGAGRKVLNPIDLVRNSRFSPLDIVIKPKCVATSTPKQKSILNYIRPDVPAVYSIESTQEKKPCVACTRLNKEQVIAISSLTNKKLASYSSSFHHGVTHMIVSTNERNCVKDHTIKFVSAVASGIWVLGFNWVEDCIAQNRIVAEEPFEVLDVSGVAGPRTARLTRTDRPLLKGYRIHAAPPFLSTTRKDIEDIVRMLGGEVVSAPEALANRKGVRIIITEARATQDFELYEIWLERFGVVTVDIEWISRSVGQYQLLSVRPFALCSDDAIADLGYPPELLVNTPFSFSQSMYSS